MRAFTILCLMLVATKFGMSLAHVLELPGKLRLDEATYKAVQAIYYPGFTIAGFIGARTPPSARTSASASS